MVLARLDDPVQAEVAAVLSDLRRRRPRLPVLVAHTGADLAGNLQTRERARIRTQERLENAAGGELPFVVLALPRDDTPLGGA